MKSIRTYATLSLVIALTLIIAACDNPIDDDADDTADVDATPATEVTGDDGADDVATDDTVAGDSTVEDTDQEAADDAATPVPDVEDRDISDDAEATDDTDAATVDDSDAEQILEQAAERASALETAQFELDGSGYIEIDEIGEVSLSNAEGSVERPDRAQLTVNVDAAIADVPVELLSVNGELYFSDPVSGNWYDAPEDLQFNPGILFDEDEGLPALIRSVSSPELLDTEELDGREAYKIYGIISQETINAGTGGVFQAEGDVDFNVWIDTETHDVLKILAEDPTDETDSIWEMRIFGHDEPVEIDDPNGDDS